MRKTTVDKRKLDVGMHVYVGNRAAWNEYAQRDVNEGARPGTRAASPAVEWLFITKLEKKYGRDVHGNAVHQHTITWDSHGNRVIWYHHFEENLRVR